MQLDPPEVQNAITVGLPTKIESRNNGRPRHKSVVEMEQLQRTRSLSAEQLGDGRTIGLKTAHTVRCWVA